MFETEQFIADCKHAMAEGRSNKAVREVVARAVGEPSQILAAFGEPRQAGVEKLYHGPELTILNLVWAPHMTLKPHDHNMWATIGIYTGGEDNIFWRRAGPGLEAVGARALRTGDVASLGRDIIHSVTNPTAQFTCALHVYGGDFFAEPRSEWDPETLGERPYDVEQTLIAFTEANARYFAGQPQSAH